MPRQSAPFVALVTSLLIVAGTGWQSPLLSGNTSSWVQATDWDTSVSEPARPLKMPPLPSSWSAKRKGSADQATLPVSATHEPADGEPFGGPVDGADASVTDIIYGSDERRSVDGIRWPYRAIVRVEIGKPSNSCTGWMANANTVITAAHCLSSSSAGQHMWASGITIHPAVAFKGECQPVRIFVPTGWRAGRGRSFDYGAIKLSCNLGNTTGWFGFAPANPAAGAGLFSIVGYDLGGGPLMDGSPCAPCGMRGRVRAVSGRVVYHELDTRPGMSGAPIYSGDRVVAIHVTDRRDATAGDPQSGYSYNSGPAITSRIYANLIAWMRAPAS